MDALLKIVSFRKSSHVQFPMGPKWLPMPRSTNTWPLRMRSSNVSRDKSSDRTSRTRKYEDTSGSWSVSNSNESGAPTQSDKSARCQIRQRAAMLSTGKLEQHLLLVWWLFLLLLLLLLLLPWFWLFLLLWLPLPLLLLLFLQFVWSFLLSLLLSSILLYN